MGKYFNVADFEDTVNDILDIGSAATAAKHFQAYHDTLDDDDQATARDLFIAMIDPNVRFGVSFVKLDYKSGLGEAFEMDGSYLVNLIHLGRPTKKNNAAIKEAWSDISGLVDQNTLDFLAKALDKKIKMSIGKKIVAGMFPGYIKLFDVMLAHKLNEKKVKFPASVEPKIDGIRCITVLDFNQETAVFSANYFTRTGKSIPALEKNAQLALDLEALCYPMMLELGHDEMILDSEVTSGDFNGTSSAIRSQSKEAKNANLCIFDVLPEGFLSTGKDQWAEAGTYVERRALLKRMFANGFAKSKTSGPTFKTLKLNESYVVNSMEEVYQLYNNCRARDLEGIIVKDRDGNYERKRSYGWMKIKANDTADLIIVGAFEGDGKYEGMLGGLIVDLEGVQVRVGGGFSDFQRKEFWEFFQLDELESVEDDMRIVGALAEVSYHEKTPDGSLRHPVFKGIRFDKEEVSF